MRLTLTTVVCVALLPACLHAADGVDLPAKANFHLYLLAGQSNMAGRGKVAEEDRTPHPRVLMLTKDGKWAPAVDPMHYDKSSAGVGLGRTFGLIMAERHPDATIGLIPVAAGGSPISTWEPGGYHNQTKSHPYDDAIKRARLAMKHGTLKAILWHQGESDCSPDRAAVYEDKLRELIARFCKDLDAPDVPFVIGQLGQFPDRPWNDAKRQVDGAHRAVAKMVRHAAFVPSDGLTHKGDKVHFNAESYREFGKRYAEVYLKMVKASR